MYVSARTVELTRRFYEWEQVGRGWDLYAHPVALEPPFRYPDWFREPIPVPDDTHRASWLRSLFRPPPPKPQALPPALPVAKPQEFSWRELPREYSLLLPERTAVPGAAILSWLESLSTVSSPLAFEYVGQGGRVTLQLACAESDIGVVRSTLGGCVPALVLKESPQLLAERLDSCEPGVVIGIEFGLGREFMLPLLSPARKGVDPLAPLIAGLARVGDASLAVLQVLFTRAARPWPDAIREAVFTPRGEPFFADAPELSKLALEKVASPLFAVSVRLAIVASTENEGFGIVRSVGAALGHIGSPLRNHLIPLGTDDPEIVVLDVFLRLSHRTGMLLSAEEMASLVGIPEPETAPGILIRLSPGGQFGDGHARDDGVLLGEYVWSGESAPAYLSAEERLSHVHVVGATGTGKSTLLVNMILEDAEAGRGVAVLDPHGDLVDEVMGRLPESRHGDVVFFDPADPDWLVGWNILSAASEAERQMLASDLVGVFQRLATSWGDQMTSVLANAILSFLDSPRGGTLSDLRRFLVDERFRSDYTKTITDPHLASYWQTEFPLLVGRHPQTPILTRLDTLLRNRLVRDVVTMRERHLEFRRIVDEGKIFLARLSQGAIGRENAALLGSLLVSKFHQVALSRQDIGLSHRSPFFIYIDEFHELATSSMGTLFSGVRKYGLGLVVAHQDMHQLRGMESTLEHAVMTNAHTRLCFRVGDEDARRLSSGFSSFDANDLLRLSRGEVIGRFGSAHRDFKLRTFPLPRLNEEVIRNIRESVIQGSRDRYGMPRPIPGAPPRPEPERASREPAPSQPPRIIPPPPEPEAPEPAREVEAPTPDGRGGPEHQYLQSLIREWAQERGYKVTLEHELQSGGRVDVVLEREGVSIACEVSVSTSVEHELENVSKCLEAGYALVLAVSLKRRFLKSLSKRLDETLPKALRPRVRTVTPEELMAWLAEQPMQEKTVAGYTVRTRVRSAETSDQDERRQTLTDVIGKSLRRLRNNDS